MCRMGLLYDVRFVQKWGPGVHILTCCIQLVVDELWQVETTIDSGMRSIFGLLQDENHVHA